MAHVEISANQSFAQWGEQKQSGENTVPFCAKNGALGTVRLTLIRYIYYFGRLGTTLQTLQYRLQLKLLAGKK